MIKTFYDVDAWIIGHGLVLKIYKRTSTFPKEEMCGITSQMKRASSSITANIAEGFSRYPFKDKVRFYYQARGSVAEVQNFLVLAKDLKFIDNGTYKHLFIESESVTKLINGLIRSIQNQIKG